MRSGTFIEAARRAQILHAAAEVVAEVGYANASLARIATHADISKSVISYHFAGKDELLSQLVGGFFDEAWAFMEPRVYGEATAGGRIRQWIAAQLEFFGQHRTRFLAVAQIVVSHRTPDGERPFLPEESEEVAELAHILTEGMAAGEVRTLDATATAEVIVRAIEGVLSGWAMGTSDLEVAGPALVDFADHAICHPTHHDVRGDTH